MERENIDFQDVYISNWNCNLLSVAGQVSRLYYDHVVATFPPLREGSIENKEEAAEVSNQQSGLLNLLEAYR